MNNGRPLTMRKKVQFLVALTILAWATQTLFAQWARAEDAGAEPAASFVPRDADGATGGGGAGPLGATTLELRPEARVYGGEVKLKQVCRWSAADAATFAPVADLVLLKLDARRPYRVIEARDVKQMLEEAGVNVALVRFSGPIECTVSRTDAELKQGEALEEWVKAQKAVPAEGPATLPTTARKPGAAGHSDDDGDARTLRDVLTADLASRLSLSEDSLVLSFNAADEAALNLPGSQFKFNVEPRRAKNLGDVAWDVTITSAVGGTRKAQVRGAARAWQNQVIVARPLARRQVIQDADVTQRRTLVDRLPESPLLNTEQVVAQVAARDLKPGTVLTAPLVEAVPLAKSGQLITVTLVRGTVKIKGVAKALEGGCFGQTIRVKNEATKDVYSVVLTGPQEASMSSAAAVASADAAGATE
jgi:flagella basal body P-ring formation protein FlgA